MLSWVRTLDNLSDIGISIIRFISFSSSVITRYYKFIVCVTRNIVVILQVFLYILCYMSFPKTPKLSDRLKYIRTLYGLSQAELAQKAGTTQQAIQQAEKGIARQPRYLNQLASELEIPTAWMVFGEEDKAAPQNSVGKQSNGLNDKSTEVLDSFYSMPEKDQKLIYELMQSRKKE